MSAKEGEGGGVGINKSKIIYKFQDDQGFNKKEG